jgi:adenylate kinase
MIILITGTPGTGKSTVSKILNKKLDSVLLDINKLVEDKNLYSGYDKKRKFKIVNLNALFAEIEKLITNKDQIIIIEGHLSHYFEKSDVTIVLRANPNVLRERLKNKGFDDSKIQENIEAEAIDLCTWESFNIHENKTNEIDTSNITPETVVNHIIDIINGKKKFPVGKVDFLEYFLH